MPTKLKRQRTYYTLAALNDGRWCIEFGDWELEFVEAELQDMRDHGRKAKELIIVQTDGMQKSVDTAIAILNSGRMTP